MKKMTENPQKMLCGNRQALRPHCEHVKIASQPSSEQWVF